MKQLFIVTALATSIFTAAHAQADWKSVDPSPDLPQVVTLDIALTFAIENNLSILQAKERIREQSGLITEIRSGIYPSVSLNSSVRVIDSDLTGPEANRESWGISLGFRQTLYSGGGLNAAIRAQGNIEKAALYELQTVLESVVQSVKTRFYNVLLARDSIEVEEENVRLFSEQLANVRNRFEAGSISQFEVLQAEVSLANAQPALIRARNQYRVAIDELREVTGYFNTLPHNLRVTPEFEGELGFEPREFLLGPALATALERRPELKNLELTGRALNENIRIAGSGYRPNVSLFGSYDARNSQDGSRRFDDPVHGWIVGIQSSWNLFDGRATRGRVVQATSQKRQVELAIREIQLGIEVEVRRALSALQEAQELATAADQVIHQAEEALRLASARFDAGSATYLDVLQAQTSLTQARNNQLRAYHSHLVNLANVERAMGTTPFSMLE